MPKLSITNRRKERVEIDASEGLSLMENIRNAGFDELLALCGGCCSCATCHVYIDDDAGNNFTNISADESELLNGSDYRQENSRLSCQIIVTASMNGLALTIAPEE